MNNTNSALPVIEYNDNVYVLIQNEDLKTIDVTNEVEWLTDVTECIWYVGNEKDINCPMLTTGTITAYEIKETPGDKDPYISNTLYTFDVATDVLVARLIEDYEYSRVESATIDINKAGRWSFLSSCKLKTVTFTGNKANYTIPSDFRSCKALENVTLPTTLNEINADNFSSCSSLRTITISASVTSIHAYAFGDCDNLSTITVNKKQSECGGFATGWNQGAQVTYLPE